LSGSRRRKLIYRYELLPVFSLARIILDFVCCCLFGRGVKDIMGYVKDISVCILEDLKVFVVRGCICHIDLPRIAHSKKHCRLGAYQ
jgi:hypothetical protein